MTHMLWFAKNRLTSSHLLATLLFFPQVSPVLPFFRAVKDAGIMFFWIYRRFPFCRCPSCDFSKSQAIVQDDPFGGAGILESWNPGVRCFGQHMKFWKHIEMVVVLWSTLLGTNISPSQGYFWVDVFPFPQVGCVSSPEGMFPKQTSTSVGVGKFSSFWSRLTAM